MDTQMKAISVRQPWAWLIVHAGKDIENRVWPTHYRGRVLVHAAASMTYAEYREVFLFLASSDLKHIELPSFEDLARGGVIGSVDIVDCVEASDSPWFFGPYGFKLANPIPLPYAPYRGQLRFFDIPEDAFLPK